MTLRRVLLVLLSALAVVLGGLLPAAAVQPAAATFSNPIAQSSDPWVLKHDGFSYFMGTDGCEAGWICVWKSATITGLATATKHNVFRVPACPAENCHSVWAPEIHNIGGTFSIYYTAAGGPGHRLFVLQATTSDPVGPYVEADTGNPHGMLTESNNLWAIDPNVFTGPDGRLYLTWTAFPTPTHDRQGVWIARMRDPLHVETSSVMISRAERGWELVGGQGVNEGPVGFRRQGKTFITFSGSGCHTPSYTVGLLTNTDGNLLDPASWVKTGPHFKFHSGVPGTGSFVPVLSPDGTEDWFLHHAGSACDPSRVIRAQRMFWDTDGTPLLGYPISNSVPLEKPAGEAGSAGTPNPFVQGWGDAFGDAANGNPAGGAKWGTWTINSPTSANVTSFSGTGWHRLFRASNPNYENFDVSVEVQRVASGGTSSFPKYGMYASYDDANNWVAVFIDVQFDVLATVAVVQGTWAAWQNAPLPAGFDPARFHTLRTVKSGATYAFLLDGVQLQQRTFSGTFPVLLNGQTGLLTEDTTANYRNLVVTPRP